LFLSITFIHSWAHLTIWVLTILFSCGLKFVVVDVLTILMLHTFLCLPFREEVRQLHHRLMTQGKALMARPFLQTRLCHSRIHSLNPICRLARSYPSLPFSRLLFQLNDWDVPSTYSHQLLSPSYPFFRSFISPSSVSPSLSHHHIPSRSHSKSTLTRLLLLSLSIFPHWLQSLMMNYLLSALIFTWILLLNHFLRDLLHPALFSLILISPLLALGTYFGYSFLTTPPSSTLLPSSDENKSSALIQSEVTQRKKKDLPSLPLSKGRANDMAALEFTNFNAEMQPPSHDGDENAKSSKDQEDEEKVKGIPPVLPPQVTPNLEPPVVLDPTPLQQQLVEEPPQLPYIIPPKRPLFILSEGRSLSLNFNEDPVVKEITVTEVDDKRTNQHNEALSDQPVVSLQLSDEQSKLSQEKVKGMNVQGQGQGSNSVDKGDGHDEESDEEHLCDLSPVSFEEEKTFEPNQQDIDDHNIATATTMTMDPSHGTSQVINPLPNTSTELDDTEVIQNTSTEPLVRQEQQKTKLSHHRLPKDLNMIRQKKQKAKEEYCEQIFRKEERKFHQRKREILEKYSDDSIVDIPSQERLVYPNRMAIMAAIESGRWNSDSGENVLTFVPQVGGGGGGEEDEGKRKVGGPRKKKVYDGNLGPSPQERARKFNWTAHQQPADKGRYVYPMSPEWKWSEFSA
jgi:hypothetical protein